MSSTIPTPVFAMLDLIFRYWGKARPTNPGGPTYHPLPYHCLDVAAVGEAYLKRHLRLLGFLAQKTGAPPELMLAWIRLLLLLHDLGKFSQGFQGQHPGLLKELQGIENSKASYSLRHDTLGYLAWEEWLQPKLAEFPLLYHPNGVVTSTWDDAWQAWVRSVTGHHGMPPGEGEYNKLGLHCSQQDQQAMLDYMKEISCLFEVENLHWKPTPDFQEASKILSWWLAGIAVLADWLGSNTDYFRYCAPDIGLPVYWEYALRQAEEAVSESGVLPVEPSNLRTFGDLLSHLGGQEPRPLHCVPHKRGDEPALSTERPIAVVCSPQAWG